MSCGLAFGWLKPTLVPMPLAGHFKLGFLVLIAKYPPAATTVHQAGNGPFVRVSQTGPIVWTNRTAELTHPCLASRYRVGPGWPRASWHAWPFDGQEGLDNSTCPPSKPHQPPPVFDTIRGPCVARAGGPGKERSRLSGSETMLSMSASLTTPEGETEAQTGKMADSVSSLWRDTAR